MAVPVGICACPFLSLYWKNHSQSPIPLASTLNSIDHSRWLWRVSGVYQGLSKPYCKARPLSSLTPTVLERGTVNKNLPLRDPDLLWGQRGLESRGRWVSTLLSCTVLTLGEDGVEKALRFKINMESSPTVPVFFVLFCFCKHMLVS
jgi:hypothetical protein